MNSCRTKTFQQSTWLPLLRHACSCISQAESQTTSPMREYDAQSGQAQLDSKLRRSLQPDRCWQRLVLIRARPWRIEPVAVGATLMSNSSVVDCQSLGLSADTNLCEVLRAQLHETLARLLRDPCGSSHLWPSTSAWRRCLPHRADSTAQILQRRLRRRGTADAQDVSAVSALGLLTCRAADLQPLMSSFNNKGTDRAALFVQIYPQSR